MVVRDTSSLLAPRFQHSEIVGLVAGFGTTFAAMPDLVAMLTTFKQGHEPEDGGYYGSVSNCLDLLRALNCVATGGDVEYDRRVYHFLSVGAYLHFTRSDRRQQEAARSRRGNG
jgi:hypothetical protein